MSTRKTFYIRCKGNSIYDMNEKQELLKEKERELKSWEKNEFLQGLFAGNSVEEDCGEKRPFNYDIEYDKPFLDLRKSVELALESKFEEKQPLYPDINPDTHDLDLRKSVESVLKS